MDSRYANTFQGNVQLHLSLPDGRKVPVPIFSQALQDTTDKGIRSADERFHAAELLLEQATAALTTALGLGNWQPPEPLTYACRASEVFAARRIDAEYYHPAKKAFLDKLSALPGRALNEHYHAVREMFDPKAAKAGDLVRNFDLTDALQPVLDDEQPPMPAREVGSTKKRFAIRRMCRGCSGRKWIWRGAVPGYIRTRRRQERRLQCR
jgi:hypothetical protein